MNESEAGKLIAEIQQAARQLAKGRRSEALVAYHDICERAVGLHAAQFQLGQLCEQIGDIDQAVTHYSAAVEQVPDNPSYVGILGIALLHAGAPDKARAILESALEIDSARVEVQHGLGVYHMQRADHERAIPYLERAAELKPSEAGIHVNLAITLLGLNRHDEALGHIRKALKLDDSNAIAHVTLCDILSQTGDLDGAEKHLEQALRKHPGFGRLYDQLARIKKFTEQDKPFIRKAEKVLDRGMPPSERCSLLYALGKMHDDCGRYDEAFAFYEQANVLQKTSYDVAADEALRKAICKAFTGQTMEALAGRGDPSTQPVFIVGMPRSGTTLMERIIASHPRAAGAGELPAMARIADAVLPPGERRKAAGRVQSVLTADALRDHAAGYLEILKQGRESAERIVDKMPGNFLYLGLIKALFPNATLIHAMRNPLDACLSCFFQNFTSVRWANDLDVISQVYATYQKMMAHWRKVLPAGSIVDVPYEELVEDPENHARRMIDACGLQWDPSVLEFFSSEGVVRTASIAQSRQPIYKTSRMRWINYAPHLESLVAGLAAYLEDDRALLEQHGIELPGASGWLKRLIG